MTAPRRPRDQAHRPYHQHGQGIVSRALPHLMARVVDPHLPTESLSPVEQAARDWRQQVLDDLGGLDAVSATRPALLDAATGSMILLASLDAYVFELAGQGGLANRKHRRVFPVVLDRMRVADGLARQLQTLGLDRQERPPVDLSTYLAQRRSSGARTESQATQAGDDHAPAEPDRNADACP
jgi:hypothetical protein